ncbi:imidazole glycerol phosphate synthase subunit HisH [Candidatus Peregrinibacteria bacterium]|nr:imidazole glycerol phosphate synthase subunit HisH [Candidatus Peregrinibacteria bacterium]
MITIIDYQISNLFSVKHACDFLGIEAEISSDKNALLKSQGAILPGVGAFGDAMHNLEKLDLVGPIKEFIASGKPFMGICLGMQLLFSESEEFGINQGLNIIPGKVMKFPAKNQEGEIVKIPQIGWNQIYEPSAEKWKNTPLQAIKNNEFMYFVHSYYAKPDRDESILSLTNYKGLEYCSSILHENVFATQFHPEKSAKEGMKIYSNWAATTLK